MTIVELDPVDSAAREIWQDALDLMGQLEGDWTLIGGLMVQLRADRYDGVGARPTNDIDILANSRTRPSCTERISEKLRQLDYQLAAPAGIDRDTAVVDQSECRAGLAIYKT